VKAVTHTIATPRAPRGWFLSTSSTSSHLIAAIGPELHGVDRTSLEAGRAAVIQIGALAKRSWSADFQQSRRAKGRLSHQVRRAKEAADDSAHRQDPIATLAEALELATASQTARLVINQQYIHAPVKCLRRDSCSMTARFSRARGCCGRQSRCDFADVLERSIGGK